MNEFVSEIMGKDLVITVIGSLFNCQYEMKDVDIQEDEYEIGLLSDMDHTLTINKEANVKKDDDTYTVTTPDGVSIEIDIQ